MTYRDLLRQQREHDLRWQRMVALAVHSDPLMDQYKADLEHFKQTYDGE